ncbi:hypothetical protein [Arsenicicoccus sp. oral taxon 190]|uniref:hypothetical protein n=1 Tax=Arsenicicoccus sp. oral taxon 190 TaxID=1658671 RepID=UPI00067A8FBC|nr:hypothetical protein [Arsenicicoccus sp. oral taxon 190]
MILAGLLVAVGLVLVTGGVLRYAAARLRRPGAGEAPRRVERGVPMTAAGGGLVLAPDVLAATGHLAVDGVGGLLLALYTVLALAGLSVVAVGMWLTSRRVTRRVVAGVEAVADGIPLLSRHRARRRGTPADFPREWAGLIALDTELTHRFLRYERDLEAAVNFPVMLDYAEPLTKGALDAMLRCRALRAATPPAGTRDVRDTDYARAVADFAVALEAAEANAQRLVASTFSEDERRVLDEAATTLEFMRANTTTPAERADAYERVAAQLSEFPRRAQSQPAQAAQAQAVQAQAGATAVARPHPFLDVEDRARR